MTKLAHVILCQLVAAIWIAVNGEWEEIDASRPLGHIVGYVDICVADLVDIVVDTINKEL